MFVMSSHPSQTVPAAVAVIEEIRAAFHGVSLGGGIGLQEANGLDDREDAETLAALRASDEKEDWEKIPARRLNHCFCSPSFLDAEGMRFHLPAFMVAELRNDYHMDFWTHLTAMNAWKEAKFALLNAAQKRAVCRFLNHLQDHSDFLEEREQIDLALEEFWGTRLP